MAKVDFLKASECLMAAIRCGSIGLGADALGVSIPQMSRDISRLEKELGVQLLVRSRSGVKATEEGAYFAERIEPLMERLEQVERSIQQAAGSEATLSLPLTEATELFPRWLSEFKEVNPEIKVSLEVASALPQGGRSLFDFSVVVSRQPRDESMIAIRICSVQLVNIASPDYLYDAGDVLEPESLSWHRLVYAPLETEQPVVLRKKDEAASFSKVDLSSAERMDNLLAVKSSVLAGGGIGIAVPLYLVKNELDRGELVNILPAWKMEPSVMWFLRPPSRFPSLVSQQLVHWFKDRAANTPGLNLERVDGFVQHFQLDDVAAHSMCG